jgi:hypothetical protein
MDGSLYLIGGGGNLVSSYPTGPSNSITSSPAVADIDNDGKPEVAFGVTLYNEEEGEHVSGRAVIWEANHTYNSSLVEWGQSLNNIWNTNSYVDVDFDHVIFFDNCPFKYNPDQQDLDHDGRGDACDSIVGNASDINTTISN